MVFGKLMMQALSEPDDAKGNALWKEMTLLWLEKCPAFGLPRPWYDMWWWPWLKNYYGEIEVNYFSTGPLAARIWIDEDLKAELGF